MYGPLQRLPRVKDQRQGARRLSLPEQPKLNGGGLCLVIALIWHKKAGRFGTPIRRPSPRSHSVALSFNRRSIGVASLEP